MSELPVEVASEVLAELSPLIRKGLLNPLTSGIPLLFHTHYDKVPDFWCGLPHLNENGQTVFVMYRPAVLQGDNIWDKPLRERIVIEVLNTGFLGPYITQLMPVDLLRDFRWSDGQYWRLNSQPHCSDFALLSLMGSPVYRGSLLSCDRQLIFSSPLATNVAAIAVARCPLDDTSIAVTNPVALATMQLLYKHLRCLRPDRTHVRALLAKCRRYGAAVLTSVLVAAFDNRIGRRHSAKLPSTVGIAFRPLLLGWVEKDNIDQECKETQRAVSCTSELQAEGREGSANTFIIAWLGPDQQSSTLSCISLPELTRWLQLSNAPFLHRFLNEFHRHSLMPITLDRSSLFSAQSDMTAMYRAAFLQELLWVLKAIVDPGSIAMELVVPAEPDSPLTPLSPNSVSENIDESDIEMRSAPSHPGSTTAQAIQRCIDTHSQRLAGIIIPLLHRLIARFDNHSLDRSDRDFSFIGLQWVAAWVGHFSCYSLLWKHVKDLPGIAEIFREGFRVCRTEQRLANLLALTQLFDKECLHHSIFEQINKDGPTLRILNTALLHGTYFQPYVHHVPLPSDPASPFYTPMTIQRWYSKRDADVMEVPVSPEHMISNQDIERMTPQPPFKSTWNITSDGEFSTVPYSRSQSWYGAFEMFRQQAVNARVLAAQFFLFGRGTTEILKRAAATIEEQPRMYATERQLNDYRCACILATWIYRCYPTLRSLMEMQFGIVFQPLVSEIHLTGCRHIDITAPENFFTITQCNTMQWAVLPRYDYARSESHLHILFRGTEGFMDIVRDMTAASGTLHVIEGATGYSIAVVNEWYVPLRVELASIKKAMHTASRYLHMVHRLRGFGKPSITMHLTGHSLGGAYATILAWMYILDAPEFSPQELLPWGIQDYRVVTFGQPPLVSQPSLEYLKAAPASREIYNDFSRKTTRVVRRLDPIPRPATSATELTALLRLAQWHSNLDVAAANLRMFAHCGDLVMLAADWDESRKEPVMRAMLLDDKQWEASIHQLKDHKLEGIFGKFGDMVHQSILKVNEFHDHSILMYLDDLANAAAGTEEQRQQGEHSPPEVVLPEFSGMPRCTYTSDTDDDDI